MGFCGVNTMEYALAARVLKLKIHISLAKVPQRGIIKYGFYRLICHHHSATAEAATTTNNTVLYYNLPLIIKSAIFRVARC
jgi:hypothetical protein